MALFLLLTGCSSDETSDASVDRGAAASDSGLTLCVENNSSRTIWSAGDGTASRPEGFYAEPGVSACTSADPDSISLNQSMMSDIGPSWDVRFSAENDAELTGRGRYTELRMCESIFRSYRYSENRNAKLSCSGNAFIAQLDFDNAVLTITLTDP